MDAATINLILELLPRVVKMVIEVGGKVVELNSSDIKSAEDLTKAIDASKSVSWPKIDFSTPEEIQDEAAGD